MPQIYNQDQQQALLSKLIEYRTWKGEGRGRDGSWMPEESHFIADINKNIAIAPGREFGQNAIIAGGSDGKATLIRLFDSFKYRFSNGKLLIEGVKKRHTHYLDNLEINPTRLGKGKDLINSEGPILSLHKNNRLLYLSSRLQDGSGRVYYATNETLLQDYIAGKCITQELLDKSPSTSFSIKHSSKSIYDQVSAVLKKDFNQQIQCGDSFFTDLSGMTPEDPTSLIF